MWWASCAPSQQPFLTGSAAGRQNPRHFQNVAAFDFVEGDFKKAKSYFCKLTGSAGFIREPST